jgi:enamine deaminase RidA (YjgF/YER057c/UK114 family)
MKSNRRNFLGKGLAATTAAAAIAGKPAAAQQTAENAPEKWKKRVIYRNGKAPEKPPRFNSTIAFGNLLFIAGVGYHKEGDITVHTKNVLDEIQKQLEAAGSSMEKCLKCNVYLADLKDYDAMNAAYEGRFGPEPPVRTTIAAAGVPGKSLVEIDVIAYI